MKIFLICGEKSGENILCQILDKINESKNNKLQNINEQIEIAGIVSDEIAKKYNIKQLFSSQELAILGIGDILFNIAKIIDRITDSANKITLFKPNLIISIDAYDFCVRVVKKIRKIEKKQNKKEQIKIWHIVAPSVWAYWSFRAKILAKYYNRLFYLLPFEQDYFKPLEKNDTKNHHQFLSTFIGYPATFQTKIPSIEKDNKLIGITIGSRINEIKRHKDLIISVIMTLKILDKNIKFVILATKETKDIIKQNFNEIENVTIIDNERDEKKTIQKCSLFIAKSGTNNIEIGSLGTPMITYYITSWLTYFFAKLFAKIKFVNLFNITLKKQIIPEFIQKQATSTNIAYEAYKIISNEHIKNEQISQINKAIEMMQKKDKKYPTQIVANEVINLVLNEKNF